MIDWAVYQKARRDRFRKRRICYVCRKRSPSDADNARCDECIAADNESRSNKAMLRKATNLCCIAVGFHRLDCPRRGR